MKRSVLVALAVFSMVTAVPRKDAVIRIDDMLFTADTYARMFKSNGRSYDTTSKWPLDQTGRRVIPFVITPESEADRPAILAGMEQWTSKTCVRFQENTDGSAKDYVKIVKGEGCSSYVGNIQNGPQDLSIGKGCEFPYIVAHELGHAMGLGHEHQRADRDQYLNVFTENISPDSLNNFDKVGQDYSTFDVPYDLTSNMHYDAYAFAVDKSKPAMSTRDASLMRLILKSDNPVGHYDALLINRAFGCSDIWKKEVKGATLQDCENFGYVNPSGFCTCPPGTTGARCEALAEGVSQLPLYPPATQQWPRKQDTAEESNEETED